MVMPRSSVGVIAFCALLCLCSPPSAAAGGAFGDDDDSVFETDIEWLAAAGITRGCNPPANDRYCPDSPVTRGQMAAFLVRAMGYSDDGGGDLFTDDDDSVFESDIDKLAVAGVTRGCNPPENSHFCPDDFVTRGQMAAFLARALNYDDGSGDWFVDDAGSVFEADIDKIAVAGVTRGCNPPANTDFCPDASVSRGQMAAFLHRALGRAYAPMQWSLFPTGDVDRDIAIDQAGNVWSVGMGGAVQWDPTDGTSRRYTAVDGLPSTEVWSVAAHPDGSVWLDTDSGLARYANGSFTEPWIDDAMRELRDIGPDGRVWFTTGMGVEWFDGNSWYQSPYPFDVAYVPAFDAGDDGSVWLLRFDDIYGFDGMAWTSIPRPDELYGVWDVAGAVDGSVWVAGTTPGRFDGSWTLYPGANGRDIDVNNNGDVWLSSGSAVSHLTDDEWEMFTVSAPDSALAVDEDGDAWLVSGSELVSYGPSGLTSTYAVSDPYEWMGDRDSIDLAVRSDGTAFAFPRGSDRTLRQYHHGTWSVVSPQPPASINPLGGSSILIDGSDRLWFTDTEAIYRLDGDTWDEVTTASGLDGQISAFTVATDGVVYFAGGLQDDTSPTNFSGWLASWDGDSRTVYDLSDNVQYPLPILDIIEASDHSLWLSAFTTVVHFTDGSFEDAPQGGWTGNWIYGMTVGLDNTVWVAHSDGVHRLVGGVWVDAGAAAGVSWANDVATGYDGSVWVATRDGAYRVDGQKWIHYTTADGVVSNSVGMVETGPDGSTWFISEDYGGLSRYGP
jgi:hypothetical protein